MNNECSSARPTEVRGDTREVDVGLDLARRQPEVVDLELPVLA